MPTVNLTPNGNVVTTGWPHEGGPDYTAVDDPPGSPDDGATKVYTPIPNDLFSVSLTDSGLADVTINSVTGLIRMYALDPDSATVYMYLTISGTDYLSSVKDTVDNNVSYVDFTEVWNTNPATSNPWTVAEVDALIMGIKKGNTAGMRCTQMYLTVDYTEGGSEPEPPAANTGGMPVFFT